jgi:hypothetical protein
VRRGPGDIFENIEPLFGRGRRREGSPLAGFGGFTPTPRVARRIVLVALAILAVAFFGPLIGVYTDWLWFKALGYETLYTTRIGYQWGYGLAATVVATAFFLINTLIALRLRGPSGLRTIGVRRRMVRTPAGALAVTATIVLGLIFGTIAPAPGRLWHVPPTRRPSAPPTRCSAWICRSISSPSPRPSSSGGGYSGRCSSAASR